MGVMASLALGQEQPPMRRPEAAGRVVRLFDFEERTRNPGEVPELWFRAQDDPDGLRRPGYPLWNRASLVYLHAGGLAHAGEGAVRLPTRGGSTSLLLGAGAVPVFPDADYRLTAFVRTSGLRHAGAAIAARLLDRSGAVIPNSEVRSSPIRAEQDWTLVAVDVIGRDERAAWLQVELLLLQPRESFTARPEPHQVWPEDFEGEAWFDDVLIVQLPRVEAGTGLPGGVVLADESPTLSILVRDLTGDRISLVGDVIDARGVVVDRMARDGGAGRVLETWKPALPAHGWYRADIRVLAKGQQVDRLGADFVWVPTGSTEAIDTRSPFGLLLDDLANDAAVDATSLASRTGCGWITIPVWTQSLTPENAPTWVEQTQRVVKAAIAAGVEVVLTLPRIPPVLAQAERLEGSEPFEALLLDPRAWEPLLGPFADAIGPRVQHWQVGAPGSEGLFWRTAASDDAKAVREAIGRLAPGARVWLTGRVDHRWPPELGPATVLVPHSLDPWGVEEAVRTWSDAKTPVRLVFEPDSETRPDQSDAHLAHQVIRAWAAMGQSAGRIPVALAGAWCRVGVRRPQLMPRPELAVWCTLARCLGGRQVVGEFASTRGTRCLMLAPAPGGDGSAALVAWNESAWPEDAVLEAPLGGSKITVIDLEGNVRSVEPLAGLSSASFPVHRVPLSQSPIFIDGIDLEWCRFLAAMRLDPPTLETTGRTQERVIEIRNTWPVSATGRITLIEPGTREGEERNRAWRITPRVLRFQAQPGETLRLPLAITVSPGEEVGRRDFVFEVEVQAQRAYGPAIVARTMELGARDAAVDAAARIEGNDVVVEVVVTNTGEQVLAPRLTAHAPDAPRVKASIPAIPPGQRAVRQLRFQGEARRLRGQRIAVALDDPGTSVRVLRSVVVR
jgi:hypothetical protein